MGAKTGVMAVLVLAGSDKLVSWLSKKQDCTAMSSAEVEYAALSASCAQNGLTLADMFNKPYSEVRFQYACQDKLSIKGRLLESFQEDAKYEHVGQDTRSQDSKDDQDKQGKALKISEQKTKSKDIDKGSRSKITKHEGTSLQHNKDQRFKNSMTKQS
ncbi:hypothetical protein Tco_0673380 [Tanacetum coccineum]